MNVEEQIEGVLSAKLYENNKVFFKDLQYEDIVEAFKQFGRLVQEEQVRICTEQVVHWTNTSCELNTESFAQHVQRVIL